MTEDGIPMECSVVGGVEAVISCNASIAGHQTTRPLSAALIWASQEGLSCPPASGWWVSHKELRPTIIDTVVPALPTVI